MPVMDTSDTADIILSTARLALRLWTPADSAPLQALSSDPAVTRFLPGPMTAAQADSFMQAQNAAFGQHRCCYFAATERASGELAGFVGLRHQQAGLPFSPCFEMGWRLRPASWGKGLATEGARAVMAYGFEVLRLDELLAFTVPANLASRRVMQRLGMRHEPADDFDHPALPPGHPLSRHVLYRIARQAQGEQP
jgi:RimJ/RimL family protein N-acetyltransferase